MSNRKRQKRPRSELLTELAEQLMLLQQDCKSYDSGLEASGKRIAVSLRILLHQHTTSRALLEQLGIRDSWFYDTVGPLNPNNLMPECNLIGVRATFGVDVKYIPSCIINDKPLRLFKRPFARWWNDPVCKDAKGIFFNRRELVGYVANTDGGAHVDPELDQQYSDLTRNRGFPWFQVSWGTGNGEVITDLKGRPELACMRQIAYEVLKTIQDRESKYTSPNINHTLEK